MCSICVDDLGVMCTVCVHGVDGVRVLVPAMYRCNLVTCVDDVSSVCVCVLAV